MKNSNSSLENLKNSKRNLSKEEMDKIAGGDYVGTCGWTGKDADGNWLKGCNTSKGHAIEMSSMLIDGRWCCDSCSQTDYCG